MKTYKPGQLVYARKDIYTVRFTNIPQTLLAKRGDKLRYVGPRAESIQFQHDVTICKRNIDIMVRDDEICARKPRVTPPPYI